MVSQPLIGVVVVNYFGGERTIRCLEAVLRSTWPADRLRVVLVDNGSEPGFLASVAAHVPAVEVVVAPDNLGLGGGCNLGIRHLRDCDHVALLNNDALPEPGWLEPLVAQLSEPRVGAATPKVLLSRPQVTVEVHAASTRRSGGDPRDRGVQLCGVRIEDIDVSDTVELVRGFWGWERDEITVGGAFAWTASEAVLQVPLPDGVSPPVRVDVRLACGDGPTSARVAAGEETADVEVGIKPEWAPVASSVKGWDVINNAGTELVSGPDVRDRGYHDVDTGQYDAPGDVFGWSAAAVLLSRKYLDEVGTFDERYFLYFEDADLSWRGRLRGWRYRYEPSSVVRHHHSATVGSRAPLASHLRQRNRLLALVKCAPASVATRAIAAIVLDLGRALWRDVPGRLIRLRRPVLTHAVVLLRVLLGFARLLPGTLPLRRGVRSGRTVPDGTILGELVASGPSSLRVQTARRSIR